ncbi:MAG: glycosyltransferase family 2 protein [Myxococcota bacterium]
MQPIRPAPDTTRSAQPPRVSVLLPVRDAEATLETCLHSLTRQTETRWQCVAVNDGSQDASPALLEDAASRDPRIEVLHTTRRGLVAALEAGLAHCRAPLVARMDADDWMHRERLELQRLWLASHPQHAAVGARVRIFPRTPALRDGRREYEAWLNGLSDPESVRADAFVECPVAHPTLMIRTRLLRELGYRDMGWPEDYDLVLRLLAGGHALSIHPRRLLSWRDHPQRLSRTAETYSLARFAQCKAAHLAQGFLKNSRSYWLWGYGQTGRNLRKALLEVGRTPSHIIELHPGRIGQRIHGAPVVHPDQLSSLPRSPLVVSVSGQRARGQIRTALERLSFEEGRDFVCAA